jgi:hypothetical protein
MDIAKQYYARLRVHEFKECKLMATNHRLCRQHYPVQVKHVNEECEAELLQLFSEDSRTEPNAVDSVAPVVDTLTVLCSGHEPSDVQIQGTYEYNIIIELQN